MQFLVVCSIKKKNRVKVWYSILHRVWGRSFCYSVHPSIQCAISLLSGRSRGHLISLLLVVTLFGLVFYALWLHPSPGLVVIINTSPTTTPLPDLEKGASHTHKPPLEAIPLLSSLDVKQGASHTHKLDHSADDSSLATLLTSLKFNNYGIVKSTDQFTIQDIPCGYTVINLKVQCKRGFRHLYSCTITHG